MVNARFEKRARLSTKADFQNVFAQPVKSGDPYLTVLARRNKLGFPRLALAISRKSAKTAVARNRIKRVIRESFRHHQHELGGADYVVIGRASLSGYGNAIFNDSLKRHWVRLAKRCANS